MPNKANEKTDPHWSDSLCCFFIWYEEHLLFSGKSLTIIIIYGTIKQVMIYVNHIIGIKWYSPTSFNFAAIRVFVSVCGGFRRSPWCRSLLCSHCCVRVYPQAEQCPFAGSNTCVRRGDGDCAERPSSPTHLPHGRVFSYHSKYSTGQAGSRFS